MSDTPPDMTAAIGCQHDYQHHPASEDFGVCALCGAEENFSTPEPALSGEAEPSDKASVPVLDADGETEPLPASPDNPETGDTNDERTP